MFTATLADAEQTRAGQALSSLVEHLGTPVIGAVNGLALGRCCEASLAQRPICPSTFRTSNA
jgi:enoyl-CoA hydratase/carnithine racemase